MLALNMQLNAVRRLISKVLPSRYGSIFLRDAQIVH